MSNTNEWPFDLDNRDYIQHYGVLGMKWGVRRYQNYDGSYTAAGLKKYRTYESATNRAKDVKGTNHKFTEEEALAETQKWMDKHQGEYSFNYTPSKKRNTVGSKLNQLVNRAITKTQSASINGLSNQTIDFGNQAIQANNWAMEQSIRANNQAASLAMTGGTNPFMFG